MDPARDADPNPRSYGVRVIVHCRSEVFAEEIEEEGLDEDAIDAKCDARRAKRLEKAAADAAA